MFTRCAAVFILVLGLSACAGIRTTDLATLSDLPTAASVPDVPFYPQKELYCGPASLAMALGWTGKRVTQDDVAEHLMTPGRDGAFRHDMVSAARRHGRLAVPVTSLRAVLAESAAGHPVVVFQNLGLSWKPVWHYAVVVGYDLEREIVVMHSGEDERLAMNIGLFERTWRRGDNWAVVVLAPDNLPETATVWQNLEAATGLERVGQLAAAEVAYGAILDHWPDAWAAHFALGNLYYGKADFVAAEAAFRAAIAINDSVGDVWNNLAHARLRLGQHAAAAAAARTAIERGGDNLDTYVRTLADIEHASPR